MRTVRAARKERGPCAVCGNGIIPGNSYIEFGNQLPNREWGPPIRVHEDCRLQYNAWSKVVYVIMRSWHGRGWMEPRWKLRPSNIYDVMRGRKAS